MASLSSHFGALLTGASPESEAATTILFEIDGQAAFSRHAFVGGGEVLCGIAMIRLPSRLGVLVLNHDTLDHLAPPQHSQIGIEIDASYLPIFPWACTFYFSFLRDICRNILQCFLRCRPIVTSKAATCR